MMKHLLLILFILTLVGTGYADDRAFETPTEIILGQSITAYFKPMIKNGAGNWNYATQAISPTPTIAIKWYQNGGLKATATGTTASPTTFTVAHWGLKHTFTPTAAGWVVLSVSQYVGGTAYNDAEVIRVNNLQPIMGTMIASVSSQVANRVNNATAMLQFSGPILDASGFDLTAINGNQRSDGGVRFNVEGISASSSKPKCSILLTLYNGTSDVLFGAYNDKSWSQSDTFTYATYGFSNINGATQFKHIFSQTLPAQSATGEYSVHVVVGDGSFTKAYQRSFTLNSWGVSTTGLLTSSAFTSAIAPLIAGAYVRNATLYYATVNVTRATAGLYTDPWAVYIPSGMLCGQTSQDQNSNFSHVVFDYDEQTGRIRRGWDLSLTSLPTARKTVLGYFSAKIGSGSLTLASRQ